MKKREILATLAVMAVLGMSACGTKELTLTADQVEAELGSELDTAVTSYVADEKIAAEAAIDFSAVDMSKVGTYNAIVTYKDQTAELAVSVVDTTAPEVETAEKVVVAADEPLYAKDVITGITELSGEVEVAFSEPEDVEAAPDAEAAEPTESAEETEETEQAEPEAEETETAEDTETASEPTEGTESTEDTEGTESIEASIEGAETEFVLDDVLCSNAYVIYPEVGEYDNTLTVTDASGNSTEVTVHIVVGDAPTISGVEDLTVTVGTDADEIDYLDGVTATDSNGNDITANIVCDSTAVDLEAEGEYEITYTVTDEDGFTATEKATVMVEEKSGKKTDGTKSDSGKTDSKSDASKANNSASGTSGSNAATASSGSNTSGSNTSGASDNSGNNSSNSNNSSNTNDGGNSGNTSGGGSTSDNSGNSGSTSTPSTPSTSNTDNSGSAGTPSTDNSGSTSTPAPETPSTDTSTVPEGSHIDPNTGMAVPDGVVIEPYDPSSNPPRDDELGGTGWTGDGWD